MRKADNLTTSCAVVMKSGNLNFLEPSGPLQACKGTALPFTGCLKNLCKCASIIKVTEPLKNWSIAYDIPEGCFIFFATTVNGYLEGERYIFTFAIENWASDC